MELGAPAPIIVAVDDAGSADAVEWAAAEAAAQDGPLHLVHALVPALTLDPYSAGALLEHAAAARSAARNLLRNAVSRAISVAPEIEVSTGLLDGTVTWSLRREARMARLLVVGSHDRYQGLRGLLAGSVAGELAGHAPCPVVVLRHRDGPVAGAARVVVAVNQGQSSSAAVGFAFRAARQRSIPLTLAHVCGFDSGPTGAPAIVDPQTFVQTLGDSAVAQTISRWQAEFPEVPVVPTLLSGEPASALTAESAGAAMLVVGSRGRRYRVGRLLGSTGQAVLDRAECPVAIIRPDHATAAPSFRARRGAARSAPR